MALRHNIRRHKPGKIAKLCKWLFTALMIIAVAIIAFILYFNGQNVKAPLVKLLSERSGVQFAADQVEFSPIYPDTVKLHGVSFSKSHIEELYLEYDVKSLLAGKNLAISDLYLRNATISPEDLALLKNNALGFDSISIATLRAKHVPFELTRLSAKDASFELANVNISKGTAPKISSGSGTLTEGLIDGISYKDLQGQFNYDEKGLVISKLSLNALGGSISGALEISSGDIPQFKPKFTSLVLDKVVLKDPTRLLAKYSFEAPSVGLNDVIAVMNNRDLLLSGINGTASDLKLTKEGLSCTFKGKIKEISRPLMQLTLEKNQADLNIDPEKVSAKLKGLAFDGEYELDAQLSNDYSDNHANSSANNGKDDYIHSLKLKSSRLELTPSICEGFLKNVNEHTLHLNNIELDNVRFLSHLDSLPVSTQAISGSISGLSWSLNDNFKPDPSAMVNLNFSDLLYQDLRVNELAVVSNYTEPLFMLSIPKASFGKSNASLSLSLSRNGGNSFLLGQAHDFELATINSSLIPHLLSGKVNLDIDLKSFGDRDNLIKNLNGKLTLNSDSLLISAFGLDLINGGRQEDFKLDLSKLLTALGDSDCGMHDVNAQISFGNEQAKYSLRSKLATSIFSLSGETSLSDLSNQGKAYFVSTPHDSATIVDISGTIQEPIFDIKALQRGLMRPGLFVKEMTPEEQAKYEEEQRQKQDAQDQSRAKLLDAVKILRDEIAVLEKDDDSE